ncbi:MAG: hypothetical protein H6656_00850 [Ardenticatenaceae bacterium]|nr:hypothetical protein [Anaerolineales bacterium]MCB9005933.1 hypothetical protein [Ardenticatenaceae bacterium]
MAGLGFDKWQWTKGRAAIVGVILAAALVGFEVFNFDTTRFALMDLLGGHRFIGLEWASILAFAFCSIDFAGVVRMFTPEQSLQNEPKEVWLLMGAWLLGATMNAVMTWYAVALTIAPRNVGATIITKGDMLFYAPIFVALLVWLTRILLIGSSSVAADRLLHASAPRRPARQPVRAHRTRMASNGEESFQEDFWGS